MNAWDCTGLTRARRSVAAPAVALATLLVVSLLGAVAPAHATHPGEDGRIAFVRGGQIYTMGPHGGNVEKLTSSGRNVQPTWSPDGRRIAYIHATDGRRDVWLMDADGQGKRAVTRTGDVSSAGAAWAPDGEVIAYGAGVLMLVPADAAGATPVVASGFDTAPSCEPSPRDSIPVDKHLAWSPTVDGGSAIAVKTTDCEGRYDYALSTYDPATGELVQRRALGADCCGYAAWSDLFFSADGRFGYTERHLGQYGDERGPRLILFPGFDSRRSDTGGAPSPSGRFMAFTSNATGTTLVMRSDIDGSDRRRLAVGRQPDWRRRP